MSSFEDDELKKCFLDEAQELLSSVEKCFLDLEKHPNDIDNLNNIFRLAHNLKGSAGAVGFSDLAEFAHKLESLLVELKVGKWKISSQILDLLLRSNDYLLEVIEKLQINSNYDYKNPVLLDELTYSLQNIDKLSSDESVTTSSQVETKSDQIAVSDLQFNAGAKATDNAENRDESIRVSMARINDLINNAGELVIYQSVLNQQCLAPGINIPPHMRATLAAMKKIIQSTRDLSMGLRMLPIKQTFQKMQRIVRDTSKALNKEVELKILGEETEVDKTVLEKISDPLVHLVRNAVDHGLEDTETRLSNNKPRLGQVSLAAFHKSGHVVIEIKDNGKGLDADRLISIAKSKGILSESAQLTKEQAYQLIFAPGFSTKSEVTDISGRGVGMDVVKTNITSLQGQIEIETELGKGTCFRILLPLTLAIVDGIVVRQSEERFVIPLAQVNEFFRPKESDINTVCGSSEVLTLRQEVLPTFRLDQLLKNKNNKKRMASELTALITRESTSGTFAVFVDEVIAQQQIVIKPLGDELKGKKGLMGSAIMGDGKPALILDLHELTKSLRKVKQTQYLDKMEAA